MHPPTPVTKRFDSIASTIEAFRNGEFIVVLDSQDRENEGDLIIAAEDVTTEQMAFMVRHTSGYVCAPLTAQRAVDLALPPMVVNNEDPKGTAYTVSVDAHDGTLTTGISAHDRALTCRTLASAKATAASLRRPGHVLPLIARDGGVVERPGHTEAAVEFCRLAGKAQVGVICEMVDDGEPIAGQAAMKEPGMMRRDACLEFGQKWGLKVCTIEDLVEYVQKEQEQQQQVPAGGIAANGHH
ncbi:3,4-dihydroxy-2-butanone 4-phosphate synthase [Capronia coronata CBS 617.96]|uniref:3,4-dihydroxy-2-butanone 4-phosphate synthase n=1 Tax=Capronia coronata CBS 617.96 TaxID=1182541 RepID=W9ZKH3_9EURO|nr:3,4-dihydroxy-2-butanone 4-phosphate synthase [Capronia coronata CBS 617.96]EXJ95004.1 3,4-dihydroxy-2-butanone 4-phosphate synthase [Capronia coronata CBS 617.96]